MTTRAQNRKGQDVDTTRHGEPTPISEIVNGIVEDLKQKNERTNANYYTPETARQLARETTAARPQKQTKLDYEVGDLVRIRGNGKRHAGDTGAIIGIRYFEYTSSGPGLIYTVKFSDYDAADFSAGNLEFIGSADND